MKRTISIAEDDANIRTLIGLFLENEGYEVQQYENGDALLASFLEKPVDLVILDIMMPGTDGLTLCASLRKKSNVPIIIVSARDSEADRIAGITLGSDDYLTKPFSPIELVARVKALFRRLELDRGAGQMGERAEAGNVTIDLTIREANVNGIPLDLTPTELMLHAYLIKKSPSAVSREELLKNVWKFDFDIDTRATDDVMKRLRKKLTAACASIQIETVWGFGFKLTPGETI